jgi:hypothetical protein
MEKITGIKATDIFGKNPTEVFPFLEGSGILANVEKALKGLKTESVEAPFNIPTANKKIWVSSEQETGSAFYFTIPFKTKDTNTNTATELKGIKLNTTNSFEKLKILIVEDDEASDMLISIAVKDLAKEIINTKNGIEAVEACRKHEDIDIILMDIQMPEMDGYQATTQIRKFNKSVNIIAQTAFALEGDMEKTMAAGCNSYITKPIKISDLKQLINN